MTLSLCLPVASASCLHTLTHQGVSMIGLADYTIKEQSTKVQPYCMFWMKPTKVTPHVVWVNSKRARKSIPPPASVIFPAQQRTLEGSGVPSLCGSFLKLAWVFSLPLLLGGKWDHRPTPHPCKLTETLSALTFWTDNQDCQACNAAQLVATQTLNWIQQLDWNSYQ